MAIYKVSFVISDRKHPGAILNLNHRPQVGEKIHLGSDTFEVTEVIDLIPPQGNFHYLHATCKSVPMKEENPWLKILDLGKANQDPGFHQMKPAK